MLLKYLVYFIVVILFLNLKYVFYVCGIKY